MFAGGIGFTGYPGGAPSPPGIDYLRQPRTPEEARKGVRELAAQHADCLKVWVTGSESSAPRIKHDILEAIVREAGEQGIPVVAHSESRSAFDELLSLGVTDFLHEVRDQDPEDVSFIQIAKQQGVSFTATLTLIERQLSLIETPALVESDPELQAVLGPEFVANLSDAAWREEQLAQPRAGRSRERLEAAQRFVVQMHRAGVSILVGSDSCTGLIAHGWATHNEMRLLAEAGIEPLEVIRTATGRAAKRLGSTQFGTIRPGATADLCSTPTRSKI